MPAGKTLIKEVEALLPAAKPGLTTDDMRKGISFTVTHRAVRYALKDLIDRGIAYSYDGPPPIKYYVRKISVDAKVHGAAESNPDA
jgi:hypothetical protein